MNIAQFCAAILYVASFEIPLPEYNRHWLARKILMQTLRSQDERKSTRSSE
jgi:hypothetical protein